MCAEATTRSIDETANAPQRLGGGVAERRHLVAARDRHRSSVLMQWSGGPCLAHAVDEAPDRVERCAGAAEDEQRGVEGAHRARQPLLCESDREEEHAEAGPAKRQLERLHVQHLAAEALARVEQEDTLVASGRRCDAPRGVKPAGGPA